MKNVVRIFLIVFGAATLLLAGCTSTNRVGGISVSLVKLQATDEGAKITLRFTNENLNPLALGTSQHKLFLNGALVGEAHNQEAIGLPAYQHADRTLNLQATDPVALKQTLSTGTKLPYRLESEIFTALGESKERFKLTADGVYDPSATH